jgi:hypothetical protein
MPTPCTRCKQYHFTCKVDLQSTQCCEYLRCGRVCDITITCTEWLYLKEEKAVLEEYLKQREAAKMAAMAKKIQVRKELVLITGQKAEAAERELACITKDEDKGQYPVKKNISFQPSTCILANVLQINPQEWSRTECIPDYIWRSPGPQSLVDDGTVFGEFDCA